MAETRAEIFPEPRRFYTPDVHFGSSGECSPSFWIVGEPVIADIYLSGQEVPVLVDIVEEPTDGDDAATFVQESADCENLTCYVALIQEVREHAVSRGDFQIRVGSSTWFGEGAVCQVDKNHREYLLLNRIRLIFAYLIPPQPFVSLRTILDQTGAILDVTILDGSRVAFSLICRLRCHLKLPKRILLAQRN